MLAVRAFAALFLACVASGPALAESTSTADFHSKVVELYSFEPHKLEQAEIQAKSGQLDQFWAMVKADPPNMLPLLRRELETSSNSAFFFFDGSKLLLALSKDRADQALALRSIAKADLRGIQPTDYVRTVHRLAGEGLDTREAAFRILAFPDIRVFIPQHSLMLGQDYSLICMLFAMNEALFVSDLATRLATEPNVQTQKSLLLALRRNTCGRRRHKRLCRQQGPSPGSRNIREGIDGQENRPRFFQPVVRTIAAGGAA